MNELACTLGRAVGGKNKNKASSTYVSISIATLPPE